MDAQEHTRDSIRAAMVELVANFHGPNDIDTILATVTAEAVELIGPVDAADVLLIDHDRFRSLAPTADIATHLDSVQLELSEGPCLDAATHDAVVICPDLKADTRWPSFAAAAIEAGVHSMMSFQLYSRHASPENPSGRGALNLFSRETARYTVEDQAIAAVLATHAATALIAADQQAQFESALASRDLIGQAKGILMERFKVGAVRAFDLMKKLSQDSNTRLRIIAEQIVNST